MRSTTNGSLQRREQTAAAHIPYAMLLSPNVVRTRSMGYVQSFRLAGSSFESADDVQLNNWHERLNVLWRNLAAPNVALWTHVIRRRERVAGAATPGDGFASHLHSRYLSRLAGETLMVNELYLSVVYRPLQGLASGLMARALSRARRDGSQRDQSDALDVCEKLAEAVDASLSRYEPQRLTTYRLEGRWYSALLEFLAQLINGEWQRVPLMRAPLYDTLTSSRLLFGTEAIEYRTPTATRVGAVLGIKEYSTPATVGLFNRLLSAPFEFVLTQSFAFVSKGAAQGLLQRQIYRMANAGDYSQSQSQQLQQALDDLTSNEFVMGDHHLSLQILTDIAADATLMPSGRLKHLGDQLALARSLLADTGMMVAREDLALEASFWAQLPGNFSLRARKAPITSRNFAAMAAFHNYPGGRAQGNHWGEALTVLVSSARSAYHFSLHASDPTDADGGSRKDTGHTFICGPTGSGKTVFVGFLIAMLTRFAATQIIFDKDRGLEILVRALGGVYLPLRSGVPTGCNPLQLPLSALNVEFLKRWLQSLVRSSDQAQLSVREQQDLDQALRGTLALEPAARRLSRLVEFLDRTDSEGMHARLSRWCASTQGDYAWVFDNPEDSVLPQLSSHALVGFDVTEFLDHELTRAPLTLYLFHLVRQLLDGRRLVCWMDEFWRLLADPAFEAFAKDGPKTWRKLNAVLCVATQSASDVLLSPISRTIIEQTPTKIFFPNVDADLQEYTGGFGLSEREFQLIKERLTPGSRSFLLKQGHHSVVCQLDLKGLDEQLRVISGRAQEVQRMHRLVRKLGESPSLWLESFLRGVDPDIEARG